jgi:hypothetical protein
VSELELALVDLGRHLEFPPTPELVRNVRARLAHAPGRGMPYRNRLLIAVTVLAVTIGAVMAVPQTRAAILEFFHLRGVTIERVSTTPTVPAHDKVGPLGRRVTLAEARNAASFAIVVPEALGVPNEVYFWKGNPPGGMVSLVYGSREHPRALLTEFQASVHDIIYKEVGPGTRIEQVAVDGDDGYWISGRPHLFAYSDRDRQYRTEQVRLAGNTLVWERGPVTLRLEADVSKAEALRIAQSVR